MGQLHIRFRAQKKRDPLPSYACGKQYGNQADNSLTAKPLPAISFVLIRRKFVLICLQYRGS